nr:MAG TPA: hypothetical protein [Caudoviricetes sp.]
MLDSGACYLWQYQGFVGVYSLLNFPYLNDLLWYCFRWQALTKIRKELTNGIGLYGRQERAVYTE